LRSSFLRSRAHEVAARFSAEADRAAVAALGGLLPIARSLRLSDSHRAGAASYSKPRCLRLSAFSRAPAHPSHSLGSRTLAHAFQQPTISRRAKRAKQTRGPEQPSTSECAFLMDELAWRYAQMSRRKSSAQKTHARHHVHMLLLDKQVETSLVLRTSLRVFRFPCQRCSHHLRFHAPQRCTPARPICSA
jgi:hypothetical protein